MVFPLKPPIRVRINITSFGKCDTVFVFPNIVFPSYWENHDTKIWAFSFFVNRETKPKLFLAIAVYIKIHFSMGIWLFMKAVLFLLHLHMNCLDTRFFFQVKIGVSFLWRWSVKKDILKNFATFTRKYPLNYLRPAIFIKRDSSTGAFLWNLRNFRKSILENIIEQLLLFFFLLLALSLFWPEFAYINMHKVFLRLLLLIIRMFSVFL